jgi:hypothetical protein
VSCCAVRNVQFDSEKEGQPIFLTLVDILSLLLSPESFYRPNSRENLREFRLLSPPRQKIFLLLELSFGCCPLGTLVRHT